ncbi:MAG: hypothetical protein WBK55_01320 [Alphaproteobacteria bacterium]
MLEDTINDLIKNFQYETDEELERKRKVFLSHVVSQTQEKIAEGKKDLDFNRKAYLELSKIIQKRQKRKRSEYWVEKIILPLLIGVIGITGVWSGTYLADKQNTTQQIRSQSIEWEKEIVRKRLEIIDRYAKLMANKASVQAAVKRNMDTSKEALDTATAYYSEYASIIVNSKIFFGPKTIAAVDKLNKDEKKWSEKEWKNEKDFMQAMLDELFFDLQHYVPKNK